ncbi:MAG: hypothetical protein GY754_38445 [bacterium]|nr:hypothetical protein [bacterium]
MKAIIKTMLKLAVFGLMFTGLMVTAGCQESGFGITDDEKQAENEQAVTTDRTTLATTSPVTFLTNGDTDITAVINDLALPVAGGNETTISWAAAYTSDGADASAVISSTGIVTRPEMGCENVSITLTATISRGSSSDSTTRFYVTVLAREDTTFHGIRTVYSTGTVGQGSSIAVDNGIVFISSSGNELILSKSGNYGETWTTSDISNGTPALNPADYDFSTSIGVDGSSVYISYLYQDLQLSIIKSTYEAAAWQSVTVGYGSDETGYHSSLAIYGSNLYISHQGYMTTGMLFTRIPKTLTPTTGTHSFGESGDMSNKGYSALAVDANNVYTAYYYVSDKNLVFAKSSNSGVDWTAATPIATEGDVGQYVSIAANGSSLYISYYDADAGNLKLARSANSGANRTISTIDSSATVGTYTSIGVNGSNVYITYYDVTNGNLKLARSVNSGNDWVTSVVDGSTENVGQYTSLAVENNRLYVSYYDVTSENLKFAKSNDGGKTW